MDVTEVKVKLMPPRKDRLLAFCSITLDHEFIVRDLKIINGKNGVFVAMPSRKVTASCPQCRFLNNVLAKFCNECGATLDPQKVVVRENGQAKLYVDIAFPINNDCLKRITDKVIAAYHQEIGRGEPPRPTPSDAFDAGEG